MDDDFECSNMTCDEGLALIDRERVQPLLRYLEEGAYDNRTNISYMKAYTVVVHFGDDREHSPALYKYYIEVIAGYIEDHTIQIDECFHDALVSRVALLWEKVGILIFNMHKVFMFLDRFFITDKTPFPNLFAEPLQHFEAVVYPRVKVQCISSMVQIIDRERDGEEVDRAMMKRLVELFCTLGESVPKIAKQRGQPGVGWLGQGDHLIWQSSTKARYKDDFEPVFLAATAEYYEAKVAGWFAERSCPEILREIDRSFEDEARRVALYLDDSTEKQLDGVLQRVLVSATAQRLTEMDSGCRALLRDRKLPELALMHRMLGKDPQQLQHMLRIFEPYIQERCATIVEDQCLVDDVSKYIGHLLGLQNELDDLITAAFSGDENFRKARCSGFESVLNKDTRCAKYIALYCDLQFKKEFKGKTEDEMIQAVDEIIVLFSHLKDKDIFLDYYKRNLATRLLSDKQSFSPDIELAFISKLKVECGAQQTQKLTAMFTDMKLSEQLMEEYRKLSHGGSPAGVSLDCRVLQTNIWPEAPEGTSIIACNEMMSCMQDFQLYYEKRHSGRKLRWLHHRGTVDMSTPWAFKTGPRKYLLEATAYQAIALILFNRSSRLTLAELCSGSGIPEEECRRHVLSMTTPKCRLLVRGGSSSEFTGCTVLEVNAQFASDKLKTKVPLLKKNEKVVIDQEPEADVPVERKHVLDAAIIRVMKARKRLDHLSLLEEVFRQCSLFKPQPNDVKRQIEQLMAREYLQRDPDDRNSYVYMP